MHITPTVQISWGELIDKITILEIKEKRLTSPHAVVNVQRELSSARIVVRGIEPKEPQLASLTAELKIINERLWDIEDKIRAKEAAKSFDQEFIDLARSVYLQNDKRSEIKRRINTLMKSAVVEEKQYNAIENPR